MAGSQGDCWSRENGMKRDPHPTESIVSRRLFRFLIDRSISTGDYLAWFGRKHLKLSINSCLVAQTLYHHQFKLLIESNQPVPTPLLFLIPAAALRRVSLSLSLSLLVFYRQTDQAESAGTFSPARLRPSACHDRRSAIRTRAKRAWAKERAGRTTSLREAGLELLGSPLEIPLVPSRSSHSHLQRARPLAPLRSSAPPLTAWRSREDQSALGGRYGRYMASFPFCIPNSILPEIVLPTPLYNFGGCWWVWWIRAEHGLPRSEKVNEGKDVSRASAGNFRAPPRVSIGPRSSVCFSIPRPVIKLGAKVS